MCGLVRRLVLQALGMQRGRHGGGGVQQPQDMHVALGERAEPERWTWGPFC